MRYILGPSDDFDIKRGTQVVRVPFASTDPASEEVSTLLGEAKLRDGFSGVSAEVAAIKNGSASANDMMTVLSAFLTTIGA